MTLDEKTSLRLKARAIREALSSDERRQKSAAITRVFLDLTAVKKALNIVLYASASNEVSTWEILENLKGKNLFLPVLFEGNIFEIGKYHSRDLLKKNLYDIWEPSCPDPAAPTPDLVVIPGLAFDEAGGRLGMGKGYYDRFLAQYPKAIRVGLAFQEQIFDKLPQKPYDVPVHFVVTDAKVYRFI